MKNVELFAALMEMTLLVQVKACLEHLVNAKMANLHHGFVTEMDKMSMFALTDSLQGAQFLVEPKFA